MLKEVKKLAKNKNLISFIKNSLLFVFIFLIEVTILSNVFDFYGINLKKIYIYTQIHYITFLFFFIFALVSFRDIIKLKIKSIRNYKHTILFGIINLISLFLFYRLNKYFLDFFETVIQSPLKFAVTWYFLLLAIGISLILTCYNIPFVISFIKQFKDKLAVSGIAAVLFYSTTVYSQKLWPFFSGIVAKAVFFLLNLFFEGAVYRPNPTAPIVGIPAIIARVYAPCSGIEGMGIFLILFSVLVAMEYNNLNKGKVLLLYVMGVTGAFAVNILRTFLIFVAGHFISAEFAIGAFHSNVGWIAFTSYFLVFIYFSYPWMRLK